MNGPDITERVLRYCAWSSLAALLIALAGFVVAGVLPFPLGPDNSPAEVVAFYSRGTRVPMGLGLSSVGLGIIIPTVAATSFIMWKRGGSLSPFALIQTVSGSVTMVCLMIPIQMMAVVGFRPDRPAALTVMLNDLAWLLFITPVAPFVIQNLAIGSGILSDRESPFPRWLGYLNLWVGFTFMIDFLPFAFHGGPFAWNGILIFWLALTSYSIWVLAMGYGIYVAAGRLPKHSSSAGFSA